MNTIEELERKLLVTKTTFETLYELLEGAFSTQVDQPTKLLALMETAYQYDCNAIGDGIAVHMKEHFPTTWELHKKSLISV